MALTRKPRIGDRIDWPGVTIASRRYPPASGVVTVVSGDLCWVLEDGHEKPQPFIWSFRDGLNTWHTIRQGADV